MSASRRGVSREIKGGPRCRQECLEEELKNGTEMSVGGSRRGV